jgi:hypothetical protein
LGVRQLRPQKKFSWPNFLLDRMYREVLSKL